MNDIEALLILNHAPGMGPVRVRQLIARAGSIAAAAAPWQQGMAWRRDLEQAEKEGVSLIPFTDARYPKSLLKLADAPTLLYVKGELKPADEKALAIVGTRQCTSYGREMAEKIAEEVASAGVTVVSGLARGIDTAAHLGALQSGRTIAVIGSGLAHLYPKENAPLAEQIARQGAVLSELPLSAPPDKRHFPRRNRLVSALSEGVFLVEAPLKSGAMITLRLAESQGKICFALPGRADIDSFQGNHSLIKTGKAQLVENGGEMVSILLPNAWKGAPKKEYTLFDLEEEELQLMAFLGAEERSLEELARETELPVAKLSALLMKLVLKHRVRELPGKLYKRNVSWQKR